MPGEASRTVAITGASGFLGGALQSHLEAHQVKILRLVRREAKAPDEIAWSPTEGSVEVAKLEGVNALVHLAGENVGAGRWTQEKKDRILNSRVQGTRTLTDALRQMSRPPQVFLSASGIGFYGNRGSQILEETAEPSNDFLSQVCQAWEAEANRASDVTRCVQLRLGMVLGNGGALMKMLPWFKAGLGGRIGSGEQYMSWISVTDAVRAIDHCLVTPSIRGPVNAVAPQAVTNKQFTNALGKALHRPALFPVPSVGLRLLYGEITDDMLGSQRAVPRVLNDSHFVFSQPDLASALSAAVE